MIPEYMKKNFDTIKNAAENDHLAVLESHRMSDGQRVFLLCGIAPPTEEDETYNITPFAEMIDGDPFELYEPPFGEDGDASEDEDSSLGAPVDDKG